MGGLQNSLDVSFEAELDIRGAVVYWKREEGIFVKHFIDRLVDTAIAFRFYNAKIRKQRLKRVVCNGQIACVCDEVEVVLGICQPFCENVCCLVFAFVLAF